MYFGYFMGKKVPIFNTLNQIYSDISLFQVRLEHNKHIPSNSVLQTLDDLKFARTLVKFLKSGSYLNLSKSTKDETLNLLSLYRSGLTREQLMSLSNLTSRQIYYASMKVEESLNLRFPTGLLSLWKNRQFEVIEEYLTLDSDEVSSIKDTLENQTLVKYLPKLIGKSARELYVSETINDLTPEEVVSALAKVLEVDAVITQTLESYLPHLIVWGSLNRYITLNKSLPADLLLSLRENDLSALASPKEFEKVEGIE